MDTSEIYSGAFCEGEEDDLYLESVPKVGVLKFHARHEAWWERRERVIHIGVPKKFLRCNF